VTETLVDWIVAVPAGHPAGAVRTRAEGLVGLFLGGSGPVAVATQDPGLWVAVWMAGRAVWWRPEGLSGVAWGGRAVTGTTPAPEDPALIVPTAEGHRVYDHRAVWCAVSETARLEAFGEGLPPPLAAIQGWASWLAGLPFGAGGYWRPDPDAYGWWTARSGRLRFHAALLGLYVTTAEDPDASTWQEGRRFRSARLYVGWWRANRVEPACFPGGFFEG
jgi:hypothetical protein